MQIAEIEFSDPFVGDCVVDPWLGQVELLVAETAPPHSERQGRWFRIAFANMVEYRRYKEEIPLGRVAHWQGGESFQHEELTNFEEHDASDEIQELPGPGSKGRLRSTAFRNEMGFRWVVRTDAPLRLVRLATWTMYLEFLWADLTGGDSGRMTRWTRTSRRAHRTRPLRTRRRRSPRSSA